jgi:hypothetical protein
MTEIVKQWLAKNRNTPGVLGFAVQNADKTNATQSCGADMSAEALEKAWRSVLEALPVLQLNDLPTARVRWVFQQGIVHCERRHDGLSLGIFTRKSPDLFKPEEVDRLLTEFHAL